MSKQVTPPTKLIARTLIRAGNNDRKHFDPVELNKLAASIKKNGLLQAITVRPVDPDGEGHIYEIIAGERRFRALELLDVAKVPCTVRVVDDETAAALMLVENTARVDLDPIAEGSAYQARMTVYKWDAAQVAEVAGVTTGIVEDRLALLRLADDVQHYVRTRALPIGHALLLVDLDNNRQRIALKVFTAASSMPLHRFRDVVQQLAAQQAEESQISMFDLELLLVSQVESDVVYWRGKRARTGAPVNKALPPVVTKGSDSVGNVLDRYIQALLASGHADAAAAIGTVYTALVAGNWASVPVDSPLAKTAATTVADDLHVE